MNIEQLIKVKDLLGLDNHTLGRELGFSCGKYQCKQIDNLTNGTTNIKPVVTIAIECLARRAGKLKEFETILKYND
jgi:hypothetical protein